MEFLKEKGIDCEFSPLIHEEEDRVLYSKGHYLKKIFLFFRFIFRRMHDIRNAKNFDVVFVYRETAPNRSSWMEKKISRHSKLVFDFDDSIWLLDVSQANRMFSWYRNPSKTLKIIRHSHLVIAGNEYLANYAKLANTNVVVFPTTIDTEKYKTVRTQHSEKPICIGWSGSVTTIKHFEYALPFLKILKEKFKEKISFKVIGDGNYINDELGIKGIPWIEKDEISELSEIAIGIMPLPDDEWSRGKCGLKGLQYMALGIPTLMSPVGVNTEIIQHGENGFLCSTTEEWTECISKLIESPELRKKLGENGRITVEEKFSYTSQKNKYLKIFQDLLESK
ncbi:MAG: glycosyltransferase family 4 protein [Bacteroidota bacterium]